MKSKIKYQKAKLMNPPLAGLFQRVSPKATPKFCILNFAF